MYEVGVMLAREVQEKYQGQYRICDRMQTRSTLRARIVYEGPDPKPTDEEVMKLLDGDSGNFGHSVHWVKNECFVAVYTD